MSANQHIDDLVAGLADWRGATLANVRRIIHEADPEIVEECKWIGSPVWSPNGTVCLGNAFKDKVKLTFPQGAQLADADKLFNNGLEGKQWRSIDIYAGDKIDENSLKMLIRSAVDYNSARVKTGNKPGGTRGAEKKKPTK